METLHRYTTSSLKWSAVVLGYGLGVAGFLLLSSWVCFQLLVFLFQG